MSRCRCLAVGQPNWFRRVFFGDICRREAVHLLPQSFLPVCETHAHQYRRGIEKGLEDLRMVYALCEVPQDEIEAKLQRFVQETQLL